MLVKYEFETAYFVFYFERITNLKKQTLLFRFKRVFNFSGNFLNQLKTKLYDE